MTVNAIPGPAMRCAALLLLVVSSLRIASAGPADRLPSAPPDGRIGYVLSYLYWALYESPDPHADCPNGTNLGPRAQFAAAFPEGRKRTVVGTQLAREVQTWVPRVAAGDSSPFYEPAGRIGLGLNLDGKVGPNDFTSPEGEPGIDNNLFRVLGCIRGFRAPSGAESIFEPKVVVDRPYNRLMLELSNVQSFVNSPNVTVHVYRGLDRLLTDSSGNNIVPGGAQHVDTRWGKILVREMKGKIEQGVLTTEPIADLMIPWMDLEVPTLQIIRDARLRLKLTPVGAAGLIGGYADVDTYYFSLLRNNSTHHLAQSDISAQSLYQALHRLADAHPDPRTGQNTAISTALIAKFAQVYINPLSEQQKSQLAATN